MICKLKLVFFFSEYCSMRLWKLQWEYENETCNLPWYFFLFVSFFKKMNEANCRLCFIILHNMYILGTFFTLHMGSACALATNNFSLSRLVLFDVHLQLIFLIGLLHKIIFGYNLIASSSKTKPYCNSNISHWNLDLDMT